MKKEKETTRHRPTTPRMELLARHPGDFVVWEDEGTGSRTVCLAAYAVSPNTPHVYVACPFCPRSSAMHTFPCLRGHRLGYQGTRWRPACPGTYRHPSPFPQDCQSVAVWITSRTRGMVE